MNGAVRISCIFNPSECCTNSGPENKASTVHLSDNYTSMLGSNVKNSQRNFVLIAFRNWCVVVYARGLKYSYVPTQFLIKIVFHNPTFLG